MYDWLKTGTVDALQAKAAAVVARNPHAAKRILGRRPAPERKPLKLAPIVLAKAPKKSGTIGPPERHPRRKLAIGEYFDVDAATTTRRAMAKAARMAFKRCRSRFGVMLTTDKSGRSVLRVTRVL